MSEATTIEGGPATSRPSTIQAAATLTMVTRRPWRLGVDLLGLLGVALAIVIWWALTFVVSTTALPPPGAVLNRIANDFLIADQLSYYGLPETGLLGSMLYTATNVLIAVVAGSLIGTVLGLITARVPIVRAVLDPILNTIGTIPILVMAPFFLIWFGAGGWSALLLVTLYVVIILYLFAQRAADNLDPVYEESARTLGASTGDILRDVLIPGTLPQILGGIRIALAGAWGLEAIAELLGAQQGIGKIIELLSGSLDMEGIFAALITLGIVAVLADFLAGRAVGFATRWHASSSTARS